MGRTKNQIQKPATVHQLNTGKWAVFVTLVQPRELEGKMRSGRQKFELQMEALSKRQTIPSSIALPLPYLARNSACVCPWLPRNAFFFSTNAAEFNATLLFWPVFSKKDMSFRVKYPA